MKYYSLLDILIVYTLFIINTVSTATNTNEPLETCTDDKGFKNMLKTKPNLLVLFGKSSSDVRDVYKLLKEVNTAVKGKATVAYIDCRYTNFISLILINAYLV